MLVTVLAILACASGTLAILAAYQKRRLTHYFFKPLTLAFIIAIALIAKNPVSSFYRYAIIFGLLLSLAGDIFLMLERDHFIQGLVSFFIAHLCYIAAFTYESGRVLSGYVKIPFFIYGVLMLRLLWPHLGKMRLPVAAYVLVILLMGCAATDWWMMEGKPGSLPAMLGALLFIASDSLLAIDKFRNRFRSAQFLILTTYFAAQLLIALST